ncbi:MAG: hypothetical protein WD557_03365 [Dehalococcoidia bacterium]
MGAKLSASVLCPGLIRTAILDAERNRPAEFGPPTDLSTQRPELQQFSEMFTAAINSGYEPEEVARQVFEAVRDDRFYIFPAQENVLESVRLRMEDIIEQRNPTMAAM